MQANYKPEHYNDLELTLNYIMTECSIATKHHKHELRQLYLSTFGEKYPELRTLVFRRQNLKEGHLIFHTDIRSKKFAELKNNPHASLMGYNHSKKYQIRFRGVVTMHVQDAIAMSDWNNLSASSRRTYLTQHSPGEFSSGPSSGFDENSIDPIPEEEMSELGLSRFVVCVFKAQQIEWLFLNPEGHRRALYTFDSKSNWLGQWLQP
jgi:hypothetical protein